jgi:hypothetical protein
MAGEAFNPSPELGNKGGHIENIRRAAVQLLRLGQVLVSVRDDLERLEHVTHTRRDARHPATGVPQRVGKEVVHRPACAQKRVLSLAHLPHDLLPLDLVRAVGTDQDVGVDARFGE